MKVRKLHFVVLLLVVGSIILCGCEGLLLIPLGPDKEDEPAPPVADFTVSPSEGGTSTFFLFTDASTGPVTSWSWNFGAGANPATATTQGPHSVTYSTTGAKTISLTVKGPGGSDTETKTNYITVYPPPVSNFTCSPLSGVISTNFDFTDASTGTITTWSWNFGTGASPATANTQGPHSVTYSTAGSKTISLTVTGPGGSDTEMKTNYITVYAITVTSPNGGETWTANEQVPVTWSSVGSISNVRIELSTNGGSSWATLVANTTNDGVENVTVPNTPSTQCLIKISDTGSSAADESDAVFTIVEPPTITVTSPNGSETWTAEDTELIEWTSTGLISNVKIELSTNGGSSWTFLATNTPNDGGHSITVPDTPSVQCLLRVSDLDDDPTDMSDGLFIIVPCEKINVVSPNGSELWRIGTLQTIFWNSELVSNVKIELSRDGNWTDGDGSNVETIVASTPAAAGFYDWTASGVTSATCLIRVSDTTDGDPLDISDAAFEIAPRVWYVDALASPGGDGKTWGTAFQTIQDGIAAASAGDDVWVKGGTYSPTINLKADVCVYGGFAGTETLVSERSWATNLTTIIGGASSAVIAADNTRFDGFTVDGANIGSDGGGLSSGASNLVIANCTFNNNEADDGGAVYLGGGSATFSNCSFTSNDADDDGGAVYTNLGAFITLDECYFYNNRARGNEGRGGAICINDSTIVVDNCIFEFNDAQRTDPDIAYGGAVYVDDSDSIIKNSRFYRNDASGMGAAIYIHASSQNTYEVINCEILRNYAIINGGGLAVRYADYTSSPVNVINCSFCNNEARDSVGGGIYNYGGSELTVVNTIIVRNFGGGVKDQIANADTSVCDVTYSCIEGWAGGGVGNINGDTGDVDFVDDQNDLRLRGTSVCIDAANGNMAPATDKDGNGRFDHPIANTGTGTPNYVDMGAYERQVP